MLWFNSYDRQARAAPGFLALLPIAVVGTVVGLRQDPAVSALLGVIVAAGGPLLMAGVVRSRGLAVQHDLFGKWGGPPTTTLLLLNQATSNASLRDQRRRHAERVTGVSLLTRAEEADETGRGADLIESAVTVLREKTRDTAKFPLVAAENRTYGFERNLLGVRPAGIATSALAAMFLAGTLILIATHTIHHAVLELAVGLVISAALLLVWMWYPTEKRVHGAAEKYAVSLVDSASVL